MTNSKVEEPLLRNSRCRQLWDKWHTVWLMAWERQRRLQEHLNYLREVEKVRNFSWDLWRKRVRKEELEKKCLRIYCYLSKLLTSSI